MKSEKDFEDYKQRILNAGNEYQVSVLRSELKINMDLLGRNKNDINEHVRLHPEFLTESVRRAVCSRFIERPESDICEKRWM